jgi:hypothetical protein
MVSTNDGSAERTPLEERAKDLFDDSVGNLDGRTRSALTQARHAALAELEDRKRQGAWKVWGTLSGAAAAALVVAVVFGPLWTTTQQAQIQQTQDGGAMPFEDFDIVADAENLELLQNLDFYAWLDSVDPLPSG